MKYRTLKMQGVFLCPQRVGRHPKRRCDTSSLKGEPEAKRIDRQPAFRPVGARYAQPGSLPLCRGSRAALMNARAALMGPHESQGTEQLGGRRQKEAANSPPSTSEAHAKTFPSFLRLIVFIHLYFLCSFLKGLIYRLRYHSSYRPRRSYLQLTHNVP